MVTEKRRIAEAKRHRAHKRMRTKIKGLKGRILHSKTRWKSSKCSYQQIWILENN